jgi:FAD synthase
MTERLLNYNEIRSRLEDRRLSYVAEKCGLTYMVLSRIKKGEGKERLIVYLKYNLSPPQRS